MTPAAAADGQLRPNQGVRFVAKLAGEVLELEQVRPGDVKEHVRIPLEWQHLRVGRRG